MKERVSQLSRGFMLPISLLPIAGLFLGIGSAMVNIVASHFHGIDHLSTSWNSFITFANFIKGSGDVIFGNLPILFAVAIAITFTSDAGGAALTAVIGWLVFNAAQAALISPNTHLDITQGKVIVDSYNLFWKHDWTTAIFTNNDGMVSLQTSVFGGIIIGAISAFMYNKFYQVEFHPIVSFFSGIRFVPIITFVVMIPVAVIFLFIWPYIGQSFAWFGNKSAQWPGGMDSFVFGYIEKALTPFGLHHAFYTPLWFSSAGGTLNGDTVATANGVLHIAGHTVAVHKGDTMAEDFALAHVAFNSSINSSGDINMWFAADNNSINFIDLKKLYSLDLGRFDQGQYPTMIFGLPAAAAAMIMTSKLEFRREATGIIGSAALTSMLTGITEPIEFTFLFLAPLLFWGFHAVMAAIAFMTLNLLGAHVGMTFSGGIIDWCIYGWLPFTLGTKPYMILLVGLVFVPIYYFVFYWAIKKWDIKTPGRSDDGDVAMITKADYKAQQANTGVGAKAANKLSETIAFIKALGGQENLKIVNACATRLRVTVHNGDLVSEAELKRLGSFGMIGKGSKSVQIILGGKANVIKSRINDYIKNPTKPNSK